MIERCRKACGICQCGDTTTDVAMEIESAESNDVDDIGGMNCLNEHSGLIHAMRLCFGSAEIAQFGHSLIESVVINTALQRLGEAPDCISSSTFGSEPCGARTGRGVIT